MGKKRKSLSSSSSKHKPEPEPEPEHEPEPEPVTEFKPKSKSKSKPKPKSVPVPESDDEESESSSSSSSSEEEIQQPESSDSDSSSDDEASRRNSIKALLEPFSRDQLIAIIREAAAKDPNLLRPIESDPTHRKLFIHGLSWETTSESLSSFFSGYGVVEECQVIADKSTGRSKGFAFLTFASRAAARKALREPQKRIDGRISSCHLATSGPPHLPVSDSGRKIFVANVGPQVSPEKLMEFFAGFGEIEQGPLGLDKVTGRFRGFAMFVYRTEEGLRKALEEPEKVFQGFKMPCSVAVAKGGGGGRGSAPAQAPAAVSGGTEAPNGSSSDYGMALPVYNPGGAFYMGHNPAAFGVMGMGYPPAFGASGLNMKVGTSPTVGGFGMQAGYSGTSPTMMRGYPNHASLQGYGAYPMVQPPPVSGEAATRPQYGADSADDTSLSYFRDRSERLQLKSLGL